MKNKAPQEAGVDNFLEFCPNALVFPRVYFRQVTGRLEVVLVHSIFFSMFVLLRATLFGMLSGSCFVDGVALM